MDSNNINVMTKEESMFFDIVHNIRNMRPLTKEMIESINSMSDIDKIKLIMTYDSMLTWINTLIER